MGAPRVRTLPHLHLGKVEVANACGGRQVRVWGPCEQWRTSVRTPVHLQGGCARRQLLLGRHCPESAGRLGLLCEPTPNSGTRTSPFWQTTNDASRCSHVDLPLYHGAQLAAVDITLRSVCLEQWSLRIVCKNARGRQGTETSGVARQSSMPSHRSCPRNSWMMKSRCLGVR